MKSSRTQLPAGYLVLALLGGCFNAGTASAGDSNGPLANWDNLKSLKPGQEVRVVMADLSSFQGEFKSWSNGTITLGHAPRERMLPRKDDDRDPDSIDQGS